ncbi:MAG TPA: single-stranded-DNA-specific exonuclease RecJ [Spirochaetota bacterium]|nr:single-stranded-DNA-specific exonuclease RecJ [Spirochaetota bacterium]
MGTVKTPAVYRDLNINGHAAFFGMHPVVMGILHYRGYDEPESIDAFLHGSLADLHSPFLFEGMRKAVERIRKAIDDRERIGIFADSDLDGITSLALMNNLFSRMKIEPFLRYLKDDENYGITTDIIDEFKDNGITLIITVDSGTRDVAEIAYARSFGIDVIVTDHHEQDRELPDAIVINPKIAGSTYPFKNLAGVGVAFKLAHAILMSYLPSYNRAFLILYGDGEKYAVSFIRDCIIEKVECGIDPGRIKQVVCSAGPDDFILVHDEKAARAIRSECTGRNIHDYAGFIARIACRKASNIEEIQRTMSIKRKVYPDPIDLLNKIFMETYLAGSEKVRDYIDSVIGLVAIGSIADVISLTGENRILVRAGLENLGRTRHQALAMLINGEKIDSRFIGWTIAPLLNTPGRLGKTELAVKFFVEKDAAVLRNIISEIRGLNEERRMFVKEFCKTVMDNMDSGSQKSNERLIHIKTDRIPDGYAGLIANRIADVTGKPVIVTVLPGKNGVVKGSGRSRGGSLFFSHFGKFSERFERIGGHENAFGFTVQAEQVDEIVSLVTREMGEHPTRHDDGFEIDCEIDISCITPGFIKDLQLLEPYGNGNREPVFMVRSVVFEAFQQFGNNHGKYLLSDYNSLVAIGWGMGQKMKDLFETGRPIDLKFRLENNYFNGKVSPRMIIIDMNKTG